VSLQLASYKGISADSDAIKVLTYSVYSHSAALFTEDMDVEVNGQRHFIGAGSVIEAWRGGVKHSTSLSERHEPGTVVDLFAFKTPLTKDQEQKIAACLISNIGKKYSYGNVARFVPIVRLLVPKPLPFGYTRTHVFCSELFLEACACGNVLLLERCNFWEIPPRDPPRSPLLYFVKTEVTH
jgi:hypothetical protein